MIQSNQPYGKAIMIIKEFMRKLYMKIEEYIHYILRCLQRIQIHPNMEDFVHVQQQTPDGISEAIVYPKSSIKNGEGVINPMFCYGFRIYHNIDEDIRHFKPTRTILSENPVELGMAD